METDCVILSKQPYQESALLVRAFSPDCGRMDLIAHGARKVTETQFPVIDLFQMLSIEYKESEKSSLGNLSHAEIRQDFSAIGDHPKHMLFAGRIAQFLLDNTQPEMPMPLTFDTLVNVFSHLADGGPEAWTMVQAAVLFKAAFLYENGLLPEIEGEQGEFLEQLIDAGINNEPLPPCNPGYWTSLNRWLDSLMEYHQLKKRA